MPRPKGSKNGKTKEKEKPRIAYLLVASKEVKSGSDHEQEAYEDILQFITKHKKCWIEVL